jgi:hypothetical protein
MDVNDNDDDVIMLDHRATNPTSTSDSILLGLNQFNIGISGETKKLSKEKWIILAVTCISIVCNSTRFSFVNVVFLTGDVHWFIGINTPVFITKYTISDMAYCSKIDWISNWSLFKFLFFHVVKFEGDFKE